VKHSESSLPHNSRDPEELDLPTLLRLIWRGLPRLVLAVLLSVAIATVYLLFATKWYRAEVVLVPAEEQSIPSLPGQLGGLAAFAGVSIGAGTKEVEALAVLRSRDFARGFIQEQELVELLGRSRRSIFGYPNGNDGFLEDDQLIDAVDFFRRKVLRISQDPKTALVTISVDWRDPRLAADWANLLASRLNAKMRERALADAEDNVAFLTDELSHTSLVGLQQSISRLLEVEMQKLMLARGNEEFAFRVVDFAEAPNKHSRPKGLLILLFAISLGLAVGFVVVFLLDATVRRT
jgi:uncharacterized protein involved in exopolysaccharide biosynthesis